MDSALPNTSPYLTLGINNSPKTPVSKYYKTLSTPPSTLNQRSSARTSSQKRGRSWLNTALSGVKTLRERSRSPNKRNSGDENASPTLLGRTRRKSVLGLYDTFRSRGSSRIDNKEENAAAERSRSTSPFKDTRKIDENTFPQSLTKRRKSLSDILVQATDKAYNTISRHSTSPRRQVKFRQVELQNEVKIGGIDGQVEKIHESQKPPSVQIPRPRIRIPTPFPRDRVNSESENSMSSSKERLERLVDNLELERIADSINSVRPMQEAFDETALFEDACEELSACCGWDTQNLGPSDEDLKTGLQPTVRDGSHTPDSYLCELIAAHDTPTDKPQFLKESAAIALEDIRTADPELLCSLAESPPNFDISEFLPDNKKSPKDAQHQNNDGKKCNIGSAVLSTQVKDLDPDFRNLSKLRVENYKGSCETVELPHYFDNTEVLCQSSPEDTSDRPYQSDTYLSLAASQTESSIPLQLEPRSSSNVGIYLTTDVLTVVESIPMQQQAASSDSSYPSRQPYPAPCGVAAQLSENFKHFQKDIIQAPHDRLTNSDERARTTMIDSNIASVVAKMIKNRHSSYSEVPSNSSNLISEEDSGHLHQTEIKHNEFWNTVKIGRSILQEPKKYNKLKYISSDNDLRNSEALLLEQILEESIGLRQLSNDVPNLPREIKNIRPGAHKGRVVSTAPVWVRFPETDNGPKYTESYEDMSKAISELYDKSDVKLSNYCTWDPTNRIIEAFPREKPTLIPSEMEHILQYIWLPMQDRSANILGLRDPLVQKIGQDSGGSRDAVSRNSRPNQGSPSSTSSTSSTFNFTMGSSSRARGGKKYHDLIDWDSMRSAERTFIFEHDSGTKQELKIPPLSEQHSIPDETVANKHISDFNFEIRRHYRPLTDVGEDPITSRSHLSHSGDEFTYGETSEDEISELGFDANYTRRFYRRYNSESEGSVTHIEDIARPRSFENGSVSSDRPLPRSVSGTSGAQNLGVLLELDCQVDTNTALEYLRIDFELSSIASIRSSIHPRSPSIDEMGDPHSSNVDNDSEFEIDINTSPSHHDSDFTNIEVDVRPIHIEDIIRPSSIASSWDNPADNESVFIGPTRTWPNLAQVSLASKEGYEPGLGLGRSRGQQNVESSYAPYMNFSEMLEDEISSRSGLGMPLEEAYIEDERLGEEDITKMDIFHLPSLTDRVDIFLSTLHEYARALNALQHLTEAGIQDQWNTASKPFEIKDRGVREEVLTGNTRLQHSGKGESLESEDLFEEDAELHTELQSLRQDSVFGVIKIQDSTADVNLRTTNNIRHSQGVVEERKVSVASSGSGFSFKPGSTFSECGHIIPVEESIKATQGDKPTAEDDNSGVMGDHADLRAEDLDELCKTTYQELNEYNTAFPLQHFGFTDVCGADAGYLLEVVECANFGAKDSVGFHDTECAEVKDSARRFAPIGFDSGTLCRVNDDYPFNTRVQGRVWEMEDFGFGGICKLDDIDVLRYDIGDSHKRCEAPIVEPSQSTSTSTPEDLNLEELWKAHNDHRTNVEIQDELGVAEGFGSVVMCQAEDGNISTNDDQYHETVCEEASNSPSKITLEDLNLRVVGKAAGERKKIGALVDIFQAQGIMPQNPKYNIYSPPKFSSVIGQSTSRPGSAPPASTTVGLHGKVDGVKISPLKHWAVFARPSSRLSHSEDTDVSSAFGEQLERFGSPASEDGNKEDIHGASYHG